MFSSLQFVEDSNQLVGVSRLSNCLSVSQHVRQSLMSGQLEQIRLSSKLSSTRSVGVNENTNLIGFVDGNSSLSTGLLPEMPFFNPIQWKSYNYK